MKQIIMSAAAVALFFSSCTKDNQKLANDLEGTWVLSSASVAQAGQTTNLNQEEAQLALNMKEITFDDCKVKKDDCTGSVIGSDDQSSAFSYTVNDEGDQVTITDDEGDVTVANVISREDDAVSMSLDASEGGVTTTVTLNVTRK